MSFCALRYQEAILAAMVEVEAAVVAEQGLELLRPSHRGDGLAPQKNSAAHHRSPITYDR
ncbi:hypothetical protein [Salinispora oceanensis]|uniref:hypothetical protein n=1 Tax=Salinispora oceanensis TaxID=1050199 RepID=UPI00037AD715|nr:hypothetical protein [Salinispora oceanensis]